MAEWKQLLFSLKLKQRCQGCCAPVAKYDISERRTNFEKHTLSDRYILSRDGLCRGRIHPVYGSDLFSCSLFLQILYLRKRVAGSFEKAFEDTFLENSCLNFI